MAMRVAFSTAAVCVAANSSEVSQGLLQRAGPEIESVLVDRTVGPKPKTKGFRSGPPVPPPDMERTMEKKKKNPNFGKPSTFPTQNDKSFKPKKQSLLEDTLSGKPMPPPRQKEEMNKTMEKKKKNPNFGKPSTFPTQNDKSLKPKKQSLLEDTLSGKPKPPPRQKEEMNKTMEKKKKNPNFGKPSTFPTQNDKSLKPKKKSLLVSADESLSKKDFNYDDFQKDFNYDDFQKDFKLPDGYKELYGAYATYGGAAYPVDDDGDYSNYDVEMGEAYEPFAAYYPYAAYQYGYPVDDDGDYSNYDAEMGEAYYAAYANYYDDGANSNYDAEMGEAETGAEGGEEGPIDVPEIGAEGGEEGPIDVPGTGTEDASGSIPYPAADGEDLGDEFEG